MQISDKNDKKTKLAEELRKNLLRRKANNTSESKPNKNKHEGLSGGKF